MCGFFRFSFSSFPLFSIRGLWPFELLELKVVVVEEERSQPSVSVPVSPSNVSHTFPSRLFFSFFFFLSEFVSPVFDATFISGGPLCPVRSFIVSPPQLAFRSSEALIRVCFFLCPLTRSNFFLFFFNLFLRFGSFARAVRLFTPIGRPIFGVLFPS